jgi:hypothetical protein
LNLGAEGLDVTQPASPPDRPRLTANMPTPSLQARLQTAVLLMVCEHCGFDRAALQRQCPPADERDLTRALHLLLNDRAVEGSALGLRITTHGQLRLTGKAGCPTTSCARRTQVPSSCTLHSAA